jgi:hypothetical protein
MVSLFGALAGMVNATLCYKQIPVRVEEFSWHIIPAGFLHGGLLVFVPLYLIGAVRKKFKGLLFICLALSAHLGGWFSWIAINYSIQEKYLKWKFFSNNFVEIVFWPWKDGLSMEAFFGPFQVFGLVSSILYAGIALYKILEKKNLFVILFWTTLAGALGSTWFWLEVLSGKKWYLSSLHGVIWGFLVAIGLWLFAKSEKPTRNATPESNKARSIGSRNPMI